MPACARDLEVDGQHSGQAFAALAFVGSSSWEAGKGCR